MCNSEDSISTFISYSHEDIEFVGNFIKHFRPLIDRGDISIWYDGCNHPGSEFQDIIDAKIQESEIVCLFISAAFLDSTACRKEMDEAFDLKTRKGINVIPIILKDCGWLDVDELSQKLALPKDGKPVSSFSSEDEAWHNVYEQTKIIINQIHNIRLVERTEEYENILNDTGLLRKSHPDKEELKLNDIFIYPHLYKDSKIGEKGSVICGDSLIDEILANNKIIISGESQSGKTSLVKQVVKELEKFNLYGLYVQIDTPSGVIEKQIMAALSELYSPSELLQPLTSRIVPIIDDFHLFKNKEKAIDYLAKYPLHILVVDDVFSINLKDELQTKSYFHYRIKELSPTLRKCLISKWEDLEDHSCSSCNDEYERLDKHTELVDSALGKILGNGIVPAYPFFVLTIISTYETMDRPLDQVITSQGHCYQTLIYLYLRKDGVKNADIDDYINFLTEFALHLHTNQKKELNRDGFEEYIKEYHEKFNVTIPWEKLLTTLERTRLINRDSLNNYSFYYIYIYYFFVAKGLSENISKNKDKIENIVSNLHRNENAYIAIFITHHSKDSEVLDEIVFNSLCLFEKHSEATLSQEEISFFDKHIDHILKASLPPVSKSPEKARAELLRVKDEIEEQASGKNEDYHEEENGQELELELRRGIKTVEVMGQIIKNRSGSLENDRIKQIFEAAMNVHLRILTSFFSLINSSDEQDDLVDFLVSGLKSQIEKTKEKEESRGRVFQIPNDEELREMASKLFWNLNFGVVYGIVHKLIHSLGSEKLLKIADSVCEEIGTPATFIVQQGMYMWYRKNLKVDEIQKRISDDGFSDTATRVMRYLIVEHCSMHGLRHDERQKVESKLGISSKRLLQVQSRNIE